jgi:hypothetical protein
MLNKTLEFIRIADAQPADDKVRKRTESAQDLLAPLKENRDVLLNFVQGIVAGFGTAPFTQDSSAVVQLIKIIKEHDATLPHDLTENALEIRAIAGVAVGELLTHRADSTPTHDAVLAALSFRAALSLRPAAPEKHIRWMLDTLLKASDDVLQDAATLRRKRGAPALQRLAVIEESAPTTDLWSVVVPAVKAALQEGTAQTAIDREEIEILWWMFAAYSKVEGKPLAGLAPVAAAFCSGIELADRALLPPSLTTVAMVRRATESGRKASTLNPISMQDSVKSWSQAMATALAPVHGRVTDWTTRYPALLPISWACRRLREHKDGSQTLGNEFTAATGIPLNHPQSPAEWGAQVFRERILQRVITDTVEK